jgi:nitrous oxidase accessory protein NosD
MRRTIALLLAAATLLTALPAVPGAGAAMMPCDGTTLPMKLQGKQPGAVVLVGPGVYCGDVFLPLGVELRSTEGAARTWIVGGTYGIHVSEGEGHDIIGFTITGAALDGIFQDDAHHGGTITIDDNVIRGNGRWGINMLTMHDIFLHRNQFLGNGAGGARFAGEHMMLMSVEFHDNMFRREPVAIQLEEGMMVRIFDNVFHDVGVAMHAQAFMTIRFIGNMVDRSATGVRLQGMCGMDVTEITVNHNVFADTATGVLALGGTDCEQPYGVTGVRVHYNHFRGTSTYAVDASTNPHLPVTARYNHWDSDLGPTPLVERLPGLGQRVSTNVDFSLWCTRLVCPSAGAVL